MHELILQWFAKQDWIPFDFQRETWDAYHDGKSGIVNAPTGMGKTYALFMGPVSEWIDSQESQHWGQDSAPTLLIWITPLRALASDLTSAMLKPATDLKLPWRIESRTGDTPSALRQKQKKKLPTVLITTPESLAILLTYEDTRTQLQHLKTIVVDEWHELLGSKRGTQLELSLSHIRGWLPKLRTWGLSATIGNLSEAAQILVGHNRPWTLVRDPTDRKIELKTLLPSSIERFPWAGHLTFKLLPDVLRVIEGSRTTLLFSNTRTYAELWYQAILAARPEWKDTIALHHGSIDRATRAAAEEGLKSGTLRCVVATSSLDLGVDFPPVDLVIQVGSPKGVGRLLQRAGRSGHQPGGTSTLICVPNHAFEIVEYAAAREAIAAKEIEPRVPLDRPLDVLVQHIVSMALAGGFESETLYSEVISCISYHALSVEEWQWAIDFAVRGGSSLKAYPEYSRIVMQDGKYQISSPRAARFHRLSVGTITSDASMRVKYLRGAPVGSVEESFIARLRPGDRFVFAGKTLELIRVRDLTAYVRPSKKKAGTVPRWMGGRLPLSTELAHAVKLQLTSAATGLDLSPEMKAMQPILALQTSWSCIPNRDQLLIESLHDREGHHLFFYPFAGRMVHEGLGALVAYRLTRSIERTISVTSSDYGIELLSNADVDTANITDRWFTTQNLLEDLLLSMNTAELARRQFRDIARIAGLVFSGYPGSSKPQRQLQASSGLFYEVFRKYDPDNLLLRQAEREVLERQLEFQRLRNTLQELQKMEVVLVETKRITPLGFPLWATRIQSQVSSERWSDRIRKMAMKLEQIADKT